MRRLAGLAVTITVLVGVAIILCLAGLTAYNVLLMATEVVPYRGVATGIAIAYSSQFYVGVLGIAFVGGYFVRPRAMIAISAALVFAGSYWISPFSSTMMMLAGALFLTGMAALSVWFFGAVKGLLLQEKPTEFSA